MVNKSQKPKIKRATYYTVQPTTVSQSEVSDTIISTIQVFHDVLKANARFYEDNIKINVPSKQLALILNTKLTGELLLEHIEELKSRSWWFEIHNRFQAFLDIYFPTTHLVAMPDIHSIIALILSNTVMIPNSKYKINPMQNSHCHDNVEVLYKKEPKLKIYSGYALSEDRLWRHHSWCVDENDNIIETTIARVIYIGYDLSKIG